MDGLRRFPSFIKCGHRTRPDAELIWQKKRRGGATTSLVSSGNKSPASAAALRGGRRYLRYIAARRRRSKVTDRSHSHYPWVMWQCKNTLYTSSITVGHSQHSHDECASFKCGVISKWNALQLQPPFVFPPYFLLYAALLWIQRRRRRRRKGKTRNKLKVRDSKCRRSLWWECC